MEELRTFESDFAFWGRRDYVHGSHMIYGMLKAVESWDIGHLTTFSANFHDNLKTQARYTLYSSQNPSVGDNRDSCTLFRIYIDKTLYVIKLEPIEKRVEHRMPDNEELLVCKSKIDTSKKVGMLPSKSSRLLINEIIALNKKIHYATYDKNCFGNWYLARIDLSWSLFQECKNPLIKIEIIKTIGKRMTKSVISFNNKTIGDIYFGRLFQK